jgi:hypothetical protein
LIPSSPSLPMATTVSTNALDALTTAILGMQRQMGDLALRVAVIEGAPSGSSPPQPSFGLPGVGAIPLLQNLVVSEVTTTQAPAATLPASYTATLGSTIPPPAPHQPRCLSPRSTSHTRLRRCPRCRPS